MPPVRDALATAAGEVGVRLHLARGSMDLGESAGGLPPDDVMEDLEEDGIPYDKQIPIGMMVEVPAAALTAAAFAREVDFFSIGTKWASLSLLVA